jgi:hypothetical protein
MHPRPRADQARDFTAGADSVAGRSSHGVTLAWRSTHVADLSATVTAQSFLAATAVLQDHDAREIKPLQSGNIQCIGCNRRNRRNGNQRRAPGINVLAAVRDHQ